MSKRMKTGYPAPGFGARVREARIAKGLTQKQLAAGIGLAPNNNVVSEWEREQTFPRDVQLASLAEVLSIDVPMPIRDEHGRKTSIRTCETCGIEFKPKANTSGRFCSAQCWYAADEHRTLEEKICPQCGISFQPRTGGQKYCGRECRIASTTKPRAYTHCERCGKQLYGNKKKRFCSHSCARLGREWVEHDVGTVVAGPGGYRKIKVGSDYPGVERSAWVLEHRYVMERMLGRPLHDYEHVHHKDGDRTNNAPENLELWMRRHPYGQRVEDLVRFVCENYPEEVRRHMS